MDTHQRGRCGARLESPDSYPLTASHLGPSTVVTPSDIYLAHTGTVRGRGVYAGRDFEEGELVEEAPVIILRTRIDRLDAVMRRRVYDWTGLTGTPNASAIAAGYGSFYNHANPSSLRYAPGDRPSGSETITYYAARDIRADEELTINYSTDGEPWCEDGDWWFRAMGVRLV